MNSYAMLIQYIKKKKCPSWSVLQYVVLLSQIQYRGCLPHDSCCLVDHHLGFVPETCLDGISNSREESFIVSRPQLRSENNMLKLCAVGNLRSVSQYSIDM